MEKFSNCFEFELLLSRCSLFKLHVYCADDRRYGQRRCEIDYEGTLNWPLNKRFSLLAKKKTSHYIMHEAMEEDDHHYSEYLLAVWRFEVSACDIWQRRRGRSRCFYSHSIAKISKNARHFVCLVFFFFHCDSNKFFFTFAQQVGRLVCLHSLESKTSNNAKLLCFKRDGRVFTSQNFPTEFSRQPPRALGTNERRIINISWSFRQRNKGKTRWLIKD